MKTATRSKIMVFLTFMLLAVFACCSIYWQWFLRVDYFIFDQQSQLLASGKEPDDQIVVIVIDDESLIKMSKHAGRWVWPRSVHAELIEGLTQHNVKSIAFDILFSEPDRYRPDADLYFNEVIAEQDNVFFSMLLLDGEHNQGYSLAKFQNVLPLENSQYANENQKALMLLPFAIQQDSWRVGAINYHAELDGVGRYYDVTQSIGGWELSSLATVLSNEAKGIDSNENKILLNWRGNKNKPYTSYSYVEIYQAINEENTSLLEQLSGKIVLIGATASGLYDARTTPLNHNLPGVYVLATAIDNLIHQEYYQEVTPKFVALLSVGCILLIAGIFYFFSTFVYQVSIAALLLISSYFASYLISLSLMSNNIALFIGTPMVLITMSFFCFSIILGYQEYLNRQQALTMFGRFLDPKVVRKLLMQGKLSKEALNQKLPLTILFSDIRNFTQLSETQDADQILTLLNNYFNQQVKVIFSQKGTLDKFIGDCIMAFWGAPLADADQAEHAINSALLMQDKLIDFKKSLPKPYQDFDIGIGIHSGEVIAGLVGTEQRVDYTVIGDAVNLASRIEGLTKDRCRVLVSEQTMQLAKTKFHFSYQGEFNVKGRQSSVKLFCPTRR